MKPDCVLLDDHKLSVVGMPSSVLTERQPTVAPSDQILAAKKSLKLWKSNRDLIFNFDVSPYTV